MAANTKRNFSSTSFGSVFVDNFNISISNSKLFAVNYLHSVLISRS